MMIHPVIDAYRAGESRASIAKRLGLTRNAVTGIIWRYKTRGAIPRQVAPLNADNVAAAMRQTNGNLWKAARLLHCDRHRLAEFGYYPKYVKKRNKASTAEIREVIDLLNESGLKDSEAADRVGINRNTIRSWRNGGNAKPFLVECLRQVVEDEIAKRR